MRIVMSFGLGVSALLFAAPAFAGNYELQNGVKIYRGAPATTRSAANYNVYLQQEQNRKQIAQQKQFIVQQQAQQRANEQAFERGFANGYKTAQNENSRYRRRFSRRSRYNYGRRNRYNYGRRYITSLYFPRYGRFR